MKNYIRHSAYGLASTITLISLAVLPASAEVTAKSRANTNAAGDQAKLQRIINRGNNEIERRISTLQHLTDKLSSAFKLSDSDTAALTNEVNGEIDSLKALKTKLDADNTVADAQNDVKTIITEYRVYVLIAPKVHLVKVAADQQAAETRLLALIPKLESRINDAKSAGKNVTSLESGLADMKARLAKAQPLSSDVESSVINLQPSDYNSDHTILSSYRDKLKTAQTDIQAAVSDAKSIVNALKNL